MVEQETAISKRINGLETKKDFVMGPDGAQNEEPIVLVRASSNLRD
jgi:hypothetical protein